MHLAFNIIFLELHDSPLHIELFGNFRLALGETLITSVNTHRMQALMAYLILHRRAPQSRQYISFLFWPNTSEKQAQTNLRQLLHHLKAALPDHGLFMDIGNKTMQWKINCPCIIDVVEFEKSVYYIKENIKEPTKIIPSGLRPLLESAVNWYKGELIPSCYDDWIIRKREILKDDFVWVLEHLIKNLEEDENYSAAISYAHRLIQEDSLRESVYCHLMRLHALQNDRAGALLIFHQCTSILSRELGVKPGIEVQKVYKQIINEEELETSSVSQARVLIDESPIVGRDLEMKLLLQAWQLAVSGKANFVIVKGEPGIGKSRLCQELLQWVKAEGAITAIARSYPAGRLSYGPVKKWLESEAFLNSFSDMEDIWLSELSHLVPQLLIKYPKIPPPGPLTENWQRQRFFEALCRAILKAGSPILLMLDDLQWCDNESLAFFLYFLHFQEESKVLIVSSMRDSDLPDKNQLNLFISTLITGNLLTEIKLNPFQENETGTLAAHIIGNDLREELVKEIYKETEGNPLYIVESLRKGLLEKLYLSKPSPPISPYSFLIGKHIIPLKVFNVLISRINQLSSPARELIELASAIGRKFSLKVLTMASNFQEDKLIGALDELWHRRIIRELEANVYDFSHDKLREVAYSSMSTAKRHRMHILIARALEKLQDTIYEDINGSLAFHYDQAGLPENAILYYKKAATKAISMYAAKEGVGFLNRALTLLDFIPNGKKRDELELELQVTLCLTFDSLTGYGAVNIQDICDRVQLLSHRLNFVPSVPVFRSMAIGKLAIGETVQALGIGEQILSLAKKNNDPGKLMEGNYVLGVINFWLGNFTTARSDLELAITFNEPDQQNLHTFPFTQNAQVICLSRLALTLWYLGYHYQAMQKLEEALSLSRKTAHPFSQAYSLYFGSWLAVLMGEIPLASKRNNEVLKLTEEQGFLHFLMLSKIQKGWLMAEEGNIKSGIKFLRQSLDDYGNAGMKLGWPYFCTLLAQAFEKDKAYEKAIDAIEEGISSSHKTNNHFNDAELYRYKGNLLWKEGAGKDEAENCLLKALKIAQQQRAKTLELKTLYDLCKIWEVQGKGGEAKFKLQNVYNWFSEEPLFQDLASAKTMLDTLESPENC